jgi:hypothetical protein
MNIKSEVTAYDFLPAILLAFAIRMLFLTYTPVFYAPDEEPHYNYVKYLHANKSIPVLKSKTYDLTNDWEYYQPPLYYIASLPFYWASKNYVRGADRVPTVLAIRFFSLLCWMGTLFIAIKTTKRLEVHDEFPGALMIIGVCFIPSFTFLSSCINNDNLVVLEGALLFYILTGKFKVSTALSLGFLLGLSMLTKASAFLFVLLVLAVYSLKIAKRTMQVKHGLFHLLLINVLGGIVCLPWLIWSIRIYGTPYPEKAVNVPWAWNSLTEGIKASLAYLAKSFWAVSGISNNVVFFPLLSFFLTGVAFVIVIKLQINRREQSVGRNKQRHAELWIGSSIIIALNIFLIMRFGILFNQAQGRFMYPLLLPVLWIVGVGIKAAFRDIDRRKGVFYTLVFFVVYDLSFMGYSLWSFYP